MQESLKIRQEIEDKRGMAFAFANLAWAENTLGNYSEGMQLLEKASEILERFEDKQITGWAKSLQGRNFFEQGDLVKAAKYAQESLEGVWKLVFL